MAEALDIDGKVLIPAGDLMVVAVRASGPGGQNVNKVSSKIDLSFDLAGTAALDEDTKTRLRALAGNRIDTTGVLRLTAQESRDQKKNLAVAREKLATLVRAALVKPKRRRATKPSKGAKQRRLTTKKITGEKKKARSTRGHDS